MAAAPLLRLRRGALAFCVLLGLAAAGCFEPLKDTHPQQVLTKRRALFKQYTRMLEPIGLVASGRKEYRADEFLALVQDLDKLADKPWAYFPADGNYPPTHARPAVWSQPAAFKAAQQHYQDRVHALLLVAQARQRDALAQAVDDVVNSCKACHRDFRYE